MSDEPILNGGDHIGKVFVFNQRVFCDERNLLVVVLKKEGAMIASKAAALVMKLSITQHHNQF
jgi:hypothetical protein